MQLGNQTSTSLVVGLPLIAQKVSKCCIDPTCTQDKVVNCYLSTTGQQQTINLLLSSAISLSSVYFTITTLNYQASYTNYTASVTTGLPSARA